MNENINLTLLEYIFLGKLVMLMKFKSAINSGPDISNKLLVFINERWHVYAFITVDKKWSCFAVLILLLKNEHYPER